MGFPDFRTLGLGRACFLALPILLVAADAFAIPVLWTLSGSADGGGILFDDDGDLNGTFVYDADTASYSTLTLKTTAGSRGSPFFGAGYGTADPAASTADALAATAISTLLELVFAAPLSNQGGSVGLASGSEMLTSGADAGAFRSLVGGEAFGVPVPEPSTACLVALGLSGMAAVRRARR
jgi:hypothetical protein